MAEFENRIFVKREGNEGEIPREMERNKQEDVIDIEENIMEGREEKEIRLEEEEIERDDIGLTTTSITKDIDSYIQRNDRDGNEYNSSDEEGERNEKEYGHEEEAEEPLSYELVDDGYAQENNHESDEEFGEFNQADGNGYQAMNGNGHVSCNEEDDNGYHEEAENQTPEYRVPSFPINKSSIPPLTAGTPKHSYDCISDFAEKIDSIKRAMQSLNITPRPTAGRNILCILFDI